jgi:hypothetical protein
MTDVYFDQEKPKSSEAATREPPAQAGANEAAQEAWNSSQGIAPAVFDVPMEVCAVIGKTKMSVSDLLISGRGTVIALDRRVGLNDATNSKSAIVFTGSKKHHTFFKALSRDARSQVVAGNSSQNITIKYSTTQLNLVFHGLGFASGGFTAYLFNAALFLKELRQTHHCNLLSYCYSQCRAVCIYATTINAEHALNDFCYEWAGLFELVTFLLDVIR